MNYGGSALNKRLQIKCTVFVIAPFVEIALVCYAMAWRFLPVPREQRLNSRSFENETAVTFVTMSGPTFRQEDAASLFSMCLIATITCWCVTGRRRRRAELAETNSPE